MHGSASAAGSRALSTGSARVRPWRRAVGAGALAVLLSGYSPAGSTAQTPTPGDDGLVVHGTVDWSWSLRTPAGDPVELADYRGRVLFINAWASWCAPCVAELRSIDRLRRSLEGSDVAWLLISPEDRLPVERFLDRYDYDLPVLLEAEPAPAAFDLRALPTTWIVTRGGRIVLRHRGAAEWDRDDVRAFLRSLVRGSRPRRGGERPRSTHGGHRSAQ